MAIRLSLYLIYRFNKRKPNKWHYIRFYLYLSTGRKMISQLCFGDIDNIVISYNTFTNNAKK